MYIIEVPCILCGDLMWPPIIRTEKFEDVDVWKARATELRQLGYNITSFWDPDSV
jgi:hypothetical protein